MLTGSGKESFSMRANSLELRQRIVAAIAAGHPKADVAALFHVDRSTINPYLRLAAANALAPKPSPGRPRRITAAAEADLVHQLTQLPGATLEEHCAEWERRHGVHLSPATMSRTITRVGWTRKKARWQPGSRITPLGLPGGTPR
jgi:transposase